jgi:hypothetical protein
MSKTQQRKSVSRSATLTIPELEQSKAAVFNTLASAHSRRSYSARHRKVHRLVLRRASIGV